MALIIPPDNGVTASLLQVTWRKASASNPSGACVELAALPGGGAAMRNGRDPSGPALIFTPSELAVFMAGVKAGDFDDML